MCTYIYMYVCMHVHTHIEGMAVQVEIVKANFKVLAYSSKIICSQKKNK